MLWWKCCLSRNAAVTDCQDVYKRKFMFSKSKKYFFDYKAISEPIAPATAERLKRGMKGGNKYGKPCLLYTSSPTRKERCWWSAAKCLKREATSSSR